ncbi:50S ribosomal protein L10 [Candidatus Purcelliella pentastirinorum]|uniref:50S ribosomal protein L10 n=1 Tax=Candidatus Purcelliella pentastirinorum TaxID=472834 RepID=UPI00237C393A|nr:50S ribosomal protein L10 [Candidatus Purcelliella pentastirinorum]WDR80536.1 50S ribosomal protein L10 [Candidatus Purcelliella pentastirinorum]
MLKYYCSCGYIMRLSICDKKSIILEIKKIIDCSLSVVVADISGIKVNVMTYWRRLARENNIYLRVLRNNLLFRIVQGTKYECLKKKFIGPTIVAFSLRCPLDSIKLFKKFLDKEKKLKIKCLFYDDKYLSSKEIYNLSKFPSYDEAVMLILIILKEVSIISFIKVLLNICFIKNNNVN